LALYGTPKFLHVEHSCKAPKLFSVDDELYCSYSTATCCRTVCEEENMFNVSRDNNWLGFSVGLPEEPPGFRIGEDGSPLPVLASRPTSPPLPSPPGTGIPPDMGELRLQTGGPIGPETMMGLQDSFADNP
jgi:hypothetical protein